jgi:hypothetical protein
MDIQNFINGMSAAFKHARSKTQMTLGDMIDRLAAMPQDAEVDALGRPISYRGYYSDLAFTPKEGRMKVSEALALCRSCEGRVFNGYKGGEFTMDRNTPVWIADVGDSGSPRIMDLDSAGKWVLESEES